MATKSQIFDDNHEVTVVFDKDINKENLEKTLCHIFDYENSILQENKENFEKTRFFAK